MSLPRPVSRTWPAALMTTTSRRSVPRTVCGECELTTIVARWPAQLGRGDAVLAAACSGLQANRPNGTARAVLRIRVRVFIGASQGESGDLGGRRELTGTWPLGYRALQPCPVRPDLNSG